MSSNTNKTLSRAAVLIVDDSKFVTEFLARVLRSIPVKKVLTAPSAEDAFYNLEQNDALADVMLLDYELRGMDGLRLLEKLRDHKNEKLRNFPVIVLTGHNDIHLYQKFAAQRISGFLIKPVSKDVLKSAIERVLAGHITPAPRLTGDLPLPRPTPREEARDENTNVEAAAFGEDEVGTGGPPTADEGKPSRQRKRPRRTPRKFDFPT